MCAGDLGMYRVMPWAYPPISGGSSGGFSPDDSGGTGGSGSTNSLYVDTSNTTFRFVNEGVWVQNNSNQDYLRITFDYSYLGVGNLNNVSKISRVVEVKSLYFTDDPSNNVIGYLKTTSTVEATDTLPFDQLINGTTSSNTSFAFGTVVGKKSVKSADIVFSIIGYDADGNEVRSYSHSLEWRA